jgi:hypothetical protein
MGRAMLGDSISGLTVVMWVSVALSAVIGVPFTLWYWKRIDQGARPGERRFKDKVDDRERVIIDTSKECEGG